MKPAYVLSFEAGLDLAEIENYTARKWGDAQAEKYLREIFDGFQTIAGNPDAGRTRPDVPPPYLAYAVGSYLIIYRHHQAKRRVEVLNVLHPAMDVGWRMIEALKRNNNSSSF